MKVQYNLNIQGTHKAYAEVEDWSEYQYKGSEELVGKWFFFKVFDITPPKENSPAYITGTFKEVPSIVYSIVIDQILNNMISPNDYLIIKFGESWTVVDLLYVQQAHREYDR